MRCLRVLTWHVHGSYLFYLAHAQHDFFLPVKANPSDGYGGRAGAFPWPANVHEVPVEHVRYLALDCVLFQSRQEYLVDQFEILSPAQRRLPAVYLEHDPPREHPTDTRHPVDDPNVLLVQVTPFNALMWNTGRTPVRVIPHGVTVPERVRYTGELARGIVVVNNLAARGRRLGADLFDRARREVPLDLIGMQAGTFGGLGEVEPPSVPAFMGGYRFFFHPARYTSLGLAVCEAMMVGLPIVGLATTELVSTVHNGVSGYVSTDPSRLMQAMRDLLDNPGEARRLGEGARAFALEHFNIRRFADDWSEVLLEAVGGRHRTVASASS
jgi:glycosyltransferase involved in cell wall biosynthesis